MAWAVARRNGGTAVSVVVDAGPPTRRVARVELLFPSISDSPRRPVGYLVGFVAALGWLLLIPAGRSHLSHVWAEDGARFLVDALIRPFGTNLVMPYAGYLHLVPRLCAQLVALLPLSWAAAGLAVSAAVVRSGIAVVVYAATGGHVRARWIRLGLAAAVVLLPAGNGEALNNLADLHWFLLYGAFWVVLWRPVGRWRVALATAVVLLAAASSTLVIGLVPLAAARFALPRWRDRVVAVGFCVGALAQLSAMVAGRPRTHSMQPFDVPQAMLAGLVRVPLVTFSGPDPVPWLYRWFGYWPAVLALLCALAVATVGIVRGRTPARLVVIAALVASAVSIFGELYVNWWPGLRADHPGVVLISERYSTAPCLFLLTATAIGLDHWAPRWRAARFAVPVLIAASIGGQLLSGTWQLHGPSWRDALADGVRQCTDGRSVGVSVAIVRLDPQGWHVGLPCWTLLARGGERR